MEVILLLVLLELILAADRQDVRLYRNAYLILCDAGKLNIHQELVLVLGDIGCGSP